MRTFTSTDMKCPLSIRPLRIPILMKTALRPNRAPAARAIRIPNRKLLSQRMAFATHARR
jgi:hypothetical protein